MKRLHLCLALLLCYALAWAIDYDKEFAKVGFVDLQKLDNSIAVEIKYSTTDNFMGINMYGDLHKAYLRPEIAKKIARAQKLLKEEDPDYS